MSSIPPFIDPLGSTSHMLTNILEQPAIAKRCLEWPITLPKLPQQPLAIAACGSSRYAGRVAKVWLEAIAGIATTVYDASEWAETTPPDVATTLLCLSQSGMTADVLAFANHWKSCSPRLGITNQENTALHGLMDETWQTPAGDERAIAATKSFLAQLILLLRLALHSAPNRDRPTILPSDLTRLPAQIHKTLELYREYGPDVVAAMVQSPQAILLGRGINTAIAHEGALKLKETAAIHAEGFAAGDFMHGPIALVEPGLPVIVMAIPGSVSYEAAIANARRVKSYGGYVVGITPISHCGAMDFCDAILPICEINALLSPILTVLPLQCLAYHLAIARGLNVDQPRNLTKYIAG